ncbi:MAG: hypothetical protein EOP04_04905 [Proteobacteria bacterium]|nr:MAG: hypothetical protein EOP04_04905 [Pseudomonadota bacterium]
MQVYRTLTTQIENFFNTLKTSNTFYKTVFDGQIDRQSVAQLMLDLTYLTSHTPIHLKSAILQSELRGDTVLANFFREKIVEEVGHDQWGKKDLKKITSNKQSYDKGKVSPRMIEMVDENLKMIDEDPYQHFIYILFAEYFTVVGTPSFVKAVQASCGIPPEYMSIIINHAELDKNHVQHWSEELDALGPNRLKLDEYVAVMKRICDRYSYYSEGLILSKAA